MKQASIKNGNINIYSGRKLITSIAINTNKRDLSYFIDCVNNEQSTILKVNTLKEYHGFISYNSEHDNFFYYKRKIRGKGSPKRVIEFSVTDDSFMECLNMFTRGEVNEDPEASEFPRNVENDTSLILFLIVVIVVILYYCDAINKKDEDDNIHEFFMGYENQQCSCNDNFPTI